MRKIILVTFLAVATQIVSAQISNGSWLLGGNVSFNSSKYSEPPENKITTFTFAPNVGYFFIDHLAGGVRGAISTEKDKPSNDKETVVLIGPFARYYFLPTGNKTNIFLDGNVMFGSDKSTPGVGASTTQDMTEFGFMAGPAIFLSDNVALELALAYNSLKLKDIPGHTSSFGVNLGFQIHLTPASNTKTNTKKK